MESEESHFGIRRGPNLKPEGLIWNSKGSQYWSREKPQFGARSGSKFESEESSKRFEFGARRSAKLEADEASILSPKRLEFGAKDVLNWDPKCSKLGFRSVQVGVPR